MCQPYFHLLTDDDVRELADGKTTWGDVQEQFNQPPWCGYPDALDGPMGCWSLCNYREQRIPNWPRIRGFGDCQNCDEVIAGCPEDIEP